MTTDDATPPPQVRLPDIPLDALPERTKDFLLAASAAGKAVPAIVVDVLNHAAAAAGFTTQTNPA